MTNRPLTVVVAPDSFKGSLSSVQVARAIAEGWTRARPADRLELAPLADGGEGTLVAIHEAGGWDWVESPATDPLGRPTTARWLRSADGRRAVVELAEASGLSRLGAGELDAGRASTHGTGEVLRAVLDTGVRHIVLGIGGSATSDGASGILTALGARSVAASGAAVAPGGDGLPDIDRVELDDLDPRLADVELRIACDVTNPLLGPAGAAATYGPQKGADQELLRALDAALGHWADALEAATGQRERTTPGAGAAGGVGFGLLCLTDRFRSLELVPGVDLVMDETGLAPRLAAADLVITGEGRIDAQTANGKTALGVARRSRAAGVPCVAVGGGVDPEGIDVLGRLGVPVVAVVERPQSIETAMAAGPGPLVRCGERLARLVTMGMELA